MSIRPNADQFAELAAAPDDQPVVMLNLLKFKARADDTGSDEAGSSRTGAESYRSYGEVAVQMIEERGGSVIWAGRADQILIGDPAQDWDQVLLVQYPSRAAFLDMVSKPEYLEAHEHRESGLERTVVVACTPALDRIADLGAR
jgi:uncharacterized protein (DUF1330 family)